MTKVIAVQIPFQESLFENRAVQACIYKDNNIYTYDKFGKFIEKKNYSDYINVIRFAVKEGKYTWTDFEITPGQIIKRNFNQEILVGDEVIEPIGKKKVSNKSISEITIKLFNEFLKTINKNSREMVDALKASFDDSLFRSEIENIVAEDTIDELSDLDKEIVVRSRIEGYKYIVRYVKEALEEDTHDKAIRINYFFRRVFNLELNSYIEF